MKVFLGWSGPTSHKVALAFHDWLPKVIQAVKPYISSEDIAKGARWATEIAKELESSNYGIISVTKENVKSEWINFEAGALSREIEKSQVNPFLFDLRSADVQGPLGQFQHTANTKDEILKLVSTINGRQESPLSKEALKATFEMWWPHLNEELGKIANEVASTGPAPPKPDPSDMLAELVDMTRAMQRESWSLSNKDATERKQLIEVQKMGLEIMNVILQRMKLLETQINLSRWASSAPSGDLTTLKSLLDATAAPLGGTGSLVEEARKAWGGSDSADNEGAKPVIETTNKKPTS